jgi:NAD(P)-dependent dehydrogenase (short-subunit alcohol dehydrogenase family)
VTQLDSMEAMYAEVMRRHGRLDAVIANAGV